jgi:AraC-like DNA-binding protein
LQAIPLVRTGSVRPVLDYLEARDLRVGPTTDRARSLLLSPTALVPYPLAGAIFEEGFRASGDPALGLRLGAASSVTELNEWAGVLDRARTIAGFLRVVAAAGRRFNTGQQFWIARRGADLCLHWRYTSRLTDGRPVVRDFSLALVLEALRLAAGDAWRPRWIRFEGAPPPHAEELAALAGESAAFDAPYVAVAISRDQLARRFPRIPAPPVSDAAVPVDDFAGSFRQLAAALLEIEELDLAVAAEAARMSERSLQRRLAEAGTSFARIVDDVRFDAACRMLGDPARKIVEISADLGYTDSANFTRAFRRWSGLSPQAFRRTG